MSQETTLYQDGDILVTKQRAVLGGKTFAMSNITSVSMGVVPANTGIAWVLIIVGVLGALCSYGLTLIVVAIGVYMLINAKPTYIVRLGSAAGEVDGLASRNREHIQQIVNALNEAIIRRG